jgi:hypothetical protein
MQFQHLRTAARLLPITACLLGAPAALAHPGHEGSLTTPQAVERGRAAVARLIKQEKKLYGEQLDESWNDTNGRARCAASQLYYLVSLENPTEGRVLHVLLNHSGKFLRARFDAGFAELRFSPFPMFDCER